MNFQDYLQYKYDHIHENLIHQGLWKTWAQRVKAGHPVAQIEKKLEKEYMHRMFHRSSRGIKSNSKYFNVQRGLVRRYLHCGR